MSGSGLSCCRQHFCCGLQDLSLQCTDSLVTTLQLSGQRDLSSPHARTHCSRSVMSDSATLWTVAHQAPLSMGFFRQEYWSGLPFPSPGDLPNPQIERGSPALWADSSPSEPPGKPFSSPDRDQTHVPCISRQVLNHWTMREVPILTFKIQERHKFSAGKFRSSHKSGKLL